MAISSKNIQGDETVHFESVRKKERSTPKVAPNLVPMIDVCFNLILFCILGFSFRQAEGDIPGSLPLMGEGGTGITVSQQFEKPVHINVRPAGDNGVTFEMEGVSVGISNPNELFDRLKSRKATVSPKSPIIIAARADVPWRWAVEAYNQAVRAKFETIGFAPCRQ